MRRSVELDAELEAELTEAVVATKANPNAVLREALRTGLPALTNKLQVSRPEGFFADDYRADGERLELESAMSRIKQFPER